jgi:hypothetical protein
MIGNTFTYKSGMRTMSGSVRVCKIVSTKNDIIRWESDDGWSGRMTVALFEELVGKGEIVCAKLNENLRQKKAKQ